MAPPATPATSSSSLSVSSSPEGIDYYSNGFYKETSRSRHAPSISDITIIIISSIIIIIISITIIIVVIIVRTAGTMVLGALGIILVWD